VNFSTTKEVLGFGIPPNNIPQTSIEPESEKMTTNQRPKDKKKEH
jgi:hypothetical protein